MNNIIKSIKILRLFIMISMLVSCFSPPKVDIKVSQINIIGEGPFLAGKPIEYNIDIPKGKKIQFIELYVGGQFNQLLNSLNSHFILYTFNCRPNEF